MFVFDDDAILKHTHRLDQLHRAALPNAIRFTLNQAAFETKKLIPKFAEDNFINRKPSFFRRFSGVDPAKGFKIDKMEASVGMIIKSGEQSTEDIEVQEIGGSLDRETAMTVSSRVSKSTNKSVKRKYKGKASPKSYVSAKGKKNFARGVAQAATKNRLLKYQSKPGYTSILEVTSVMRNLRSKKLKIKSVNIASEEKGRKYNIGKRPFVGPASLEAGKQLNTFYRQNAAKQIKKFS